ncbi:CPBP family intramembrane glutamic endopeptidase [Sphingomonas sanguinis]|uniref:CPBP family intramembrane metalloprotease n=1 Tax=Sphingomonas sanguinis TaxID=33051 RepID=A0A7Y7US43_9SPHN|nr:CPBP family intramembrane glutamic endopeptidase [Sphingomonas sanguinis]MBZ6383284.1 CPBP family intramembrane metalloprotease [Sphingomonas sanguinis]NNG49948.1 CPBP family intramembrane metalloprotease [Sphingomonas sanguinis]NNG53715.1 CPBP family intramembrane metalloprotease [Sphingomonas sanguinis]NVP32579.1 CPBP family intramembrane metalloprotease [Sphingomonas sanguinis]
MIPAPVLAGLLLLAALGGVWWFQKGDLGEYRRFCALDDSHSRRMRFRLWLARSALAFLLPVLVGLALLGRVGAWAVMPGEFAAAAGVMPSIFDDDGALSSLLIGGATGGLVAGALIARFRRRKPIGNVSALLPRERREVKYALALSVTAGVTEEAFFRLYLPLLVAMLTGQAWIGFAASLILFGAMHRYQGWAGVLATTALGAVMTGLYLMTGSLWVVMLVHTLVDVNGLVVLPLTNGVLKK